MNFDLETEESAHYTDRQSEVSGRADLHGILAEEFSEVIVRESFVVVILGDHACLKSQILSVLENLIDAASGFDRTGDRQMRVHLEKKSARDLSIISLDESLLHSAYISQRRLDQAIVFSSLREAFLNVWSKSVEPLLCISDVVVTDDQLADTVNQAERKMLWVDPQSFFLISYVSENRIHFYHFTCVVLNTHI